MQQFNFKELQASYGLTFREAQYKMSLVYVRNRIFLRFQSLSEITLNLRRLGISWAFAGRSIHEETFPAFCRPGRGRCRKNGWLKQENLTAFQSISFSLVGPAEDVVEKMAG